MDTKKDSIAASNAWKNFRKEYMDRSGKTSVQRQEDGSYKKVEIPTSAEENEAEYDREKNEFYYDIKSGKMKLIPTDDGEKQDQSGIQAWQLAPSMKAKEIIGQDTGKVKTDKKGEYVMHAKDTIRPADNKKFRPFVQGKQSGKMESGYLSDDNYTIKDGKLNPIKKSPLQMVGIQSPLNHKPQSGRAHIHRKSGSGVAYEGDASFEKFKKEGGSVQPKGKAYESRDAYLKDSSRNKPHKAPSMKEDPKRGEAGFQQDPQEARFEKMSDQMNEQNKPLSESEKKRMHAVSSINDKHVVSSGGVDLGVIKSKSALNMLGINSPLNKISGPCKSAAKKKFKVWPSAYASGWGVRCTKAGGPSKFGGGKKK